MDGSRNHLLIRNLDEYDIGYLGALLNNNQPVIAGYEQDAAKSGFGPLAPCTFQASASEQKQLCRMSFTGSPLSNLMSIL